ncbi:putative peroxisomal membrane protein PEX13-like [Trifolium pratense]|uniref:Putative peroxisomal membrane protein PEX13-like n=1 Tax=Trifolium pratense TaxID=57577 RepID=A0A2K3MBM2_TRIPR|nr:putative peroxisomal membrane protein PEX13-like [Trifolium pratense]
MASRYELELTLTSAKQLKNVNWRHGTNKPYAVVYIDPIIKFTTNIDQNGNTESQWKNQTLIIPLPSKPIKDLILYIQIVHAGFEENTKKLIGSARLKVVEVFENGIGKCVSRMLTLERPSGRPQGKVDVKVGIREISYRAQGVDFGNEEFKSREYSSSSRVYGSVRPQQRYNMGGKRKSEFGEMGIGFAVGAVAGVLGGLALEKGVEYVEDRIVDDVVERVEEDLGYNDDGVENADDDIDYDDDVEENVDDDVSYVDDDDVEENVEDDFGYDDDDAGGYDGDDF